VLKRCRAVANSTVSADSLEYTDANAPVLKDGTPCALFFVAVYSRIEKGLRIHSKIDSYCTLGLYLWVLSAE
jgi:hypothetical protein